MEEKLLVKDTLYFLDNLISFETDSLFKITSFEYRNYFKVIRQSDESFKEELKNLAISKGYIEKEKIVQENFLIELKQNIL